MDRQAGIGAAGRQQPAAAGVIGQRVDVAAGGGAGQHRAAVRVQAQQARIGAAAGDEQPLAGGVGDQGAGARALRRLPQARQRHAAQVDDGNAALVAQRQCHHARPEQRGRVELGGRQVEAGAHAVAGRIEAVDARHGAAAAAGDQHLAAVGVVQHVVEVADVERHALEHLPVGGPHHDHAAVHAGHVEPVGRRHGGDGVGAFGAGYPGLRLAAGGVVDGQAVLAARQQQFGAVARQGREAPTVAAAGQRGGAALGHDGIAGGGRFGAGRGLGDQGRGGAGGGQGGAQARRGSARECGRREGGDGRPHAQNSIRVDSTNWRASPMEMKYWLALEV
ncbi:hypothetical protein WJ972_07390 [Achromobacter insuavis]